MRNNTMNDADFCREHGLKVGDVLQGDECGKVDTVRITAIGDRLVLCVWNEKGEAVTTFSCREWRKV